MARNTLDASSETSPPHAVHWECASRRSCVGRRIDVWPHFAQVIGICALSNGPTEQPPLFIVI
jgi:hypothetical protein